MVNERATLEIEDTNSGETRELKAGRTYSLGRNRDNDVPIPYGETRDKCKEDTPNGKILRNLAQGISRYHATIETEPEGERITIHDKSRAGTYVSGEKVPEEGLIAKLPVTIHFAVPNALGIKVSKKENGC